MTIYNYHPETLEFTGESVADPSPLEPGVWLIPAHSTEIAPPDTTANEVAVFSGGEWSLEPDYRGHRAWLPADYDDETGTEITEIGPLGERSLTRPDVPEEIQEARAAAITRTQTRAALAEQWAALPAWIRGPYGARYAEVVRLLDANDDDAAIAIVEYAAPPAGYDEEKKAAFDFVRADLLAALQIIKTH